MLRTYLMIAWRNILKNGLYSGVNVVGLLAGIAFALLIGAYAWGEWQVNRQLRHADRQYFLTSRWKDPNMGLEITTAAPLGKLLKEQYPHLVANYYRWDGLTSGVSKGDKHFRESIQLGDSTLLSMFGFELLHGDARTALKNPYSVVITAPEALKYFGRTDVVGQTLTIQSFNGGKRDFAITGVLKEIPENSVTQINASIKNTFFIPTNTLAYFGRTSFDDWNNTVLPSYVELREGVTARDLEAPIRQLLGRHAPEGIRQNLTVHPVALTDYYLQKDGGLVRQMVSALLLVAAFILLMAVVNFINLAVSRSGTRLREVGVRKVLGGLRRQLVFQFLAESVLLVLVATVLAFAAYPLLQPLFARMIGKEIADLTHFPAYFGFVPVAIVLVVGLAAGLYPAFVLSSLNTVDSLKGKLKTVKDKVVLRKRLPVLPGKHRTHCGGPGHPAGEPFFQRAAGLRQGVRRVGPGAPGLVAGGGAQDGNRAGRICRPARGEPRELVARNSQRQQRRPAHGVPAGRRFCAGRSHAGHDLRRKLPGHVPDSPAGRRLFRRPGTRFGQSSTQ